MRSNASEIKDLGEAVRFEDRQFSYDGQAPRHKPATRDRDLPGIVETLYSEHRYIHSLLDVLDAQAEKLVPGKIPNYHLMLDVVEYLTHYPDQYHHPREDLLFGSLLEHDKGFKKYVNRLEREHQTLRAYNDQLFRELRAIAAGRRLKQSQLRSSLERYVNGYRKHMDFESREIFPRAKGHLSKRDLARLDTRTRYINDPVFGGEVQKRFRRLARNLEASIGGLGFNFASRELSLLENVLGKLTEGIVAIDQARERLRSLSLLPRRAYRPSWQARAINGCTRVTMKPLMRYGTIESARMMGGFEEQQEKMLPDDIRARKVSKEGYEGEWVQIKGKRPRHVILYFPGGGFILRTATQHKGMVARICRAAGTKGLVVHYRLAPEVPFPGGLEDCLAAYHDLLEQGIDPANITIAGDSAGGGLVLSTLLALRDEGTPMPKNAIVMSPLADLTCSGKSRVTNKYRDPMLPTARASQMHQLYIGDASPMDRFLSPVFADFDGLPPILGLVGSTEMLLDDTLRTAKRAASAGVPFYLEVWRELPHVFPIFAILPETQVSMERMAEFIHNSEVDPLPERYGWSDLDSEVS